MRIPKFGMDVTTLLVRNFPEDDLRRFCERIRKHLVEEVRVFGFWIQRGMINPYRGKNGIPDLSQKRMKYEKAVLKLKKILKDEFEIEPIVSFQDKCGIKNKGNPWRINVQKINLFFNTSPEAMEWKLDYFSWLFDLGIRKFEYMNEARHPADPNKSKVKQWVREEILPIAEHMKRKGIEMPLYSSSQGDVTGHKIIGVLTEEGSFGLEDVVWIRHAWALPIDVYDEMYENNGEYKYSRKRALAFSDDGVKCEKTGRPKCGPGIPKRKKAVFRQMGTRDRVAIVETVKAISEKEGSPIEIIYYLPRSIDIDHISNLKKDLDLMIYPRILKRVYGIENPI